ncbi:MAG: YibE/F family protein [Anaerolineae bacterium]
MTRLRFPPLIALTALVCVILVVPVSAAVLQSSAPSEHISYQGQVTQEENLEGQVVEILDEKQVTPKGADASQLYQKLAILVTRGSLKGETITVENGLYPTSDPHRYAVGDRLVIRFTVNTAKEANYYISDYVRRAPLLGLLLIFIVLTIIVGRWQGLNSLIGMAISFLVILLYILPKIYAGEDPVRIAIIGSLVILPATFLLSHGVNLKTTVALVGTLIALVITGLLANVYINMARLTGFASEEAGFLQAYHPGLINIRGLILAGIIIGVLGILDDITISQAAIVQQLKLANAELSIWRLFAQAMAVGRDHIASMVNTLILVYAGAALPLLLLFIDNAHPITEVLNYEVIAEEIVRTLVGSIGLIIAVPITTILAAVTVQLVKSWKDYFKPATEV